MKIVNLTPHSLNLYDESNRLVVVVPPSGDVARVAVRRERVGDADGVPLYRSHYGAVEGLPAPRPGVLYVTSALVLAAVREARPDVWAPGEPVRDAEGRVVGAVGLQR